MKKKLFIVVTNLLFIYVFLCLNLELIAQKGNQRGAITRTTEQSNEKGSTRALIVGISDYYSDALDLKYADNDAILFYLFLINNSLIDIKQENIRILLNKDATVDNILKELDWLKDNAGKNDKTIIYFAGHADVVKVVDGEAGFFLTHFASDQREYRAGGTIPFSHVELVTDTIASRGSKVWMITDACRSGNIINEDGAKLSLTALNANFNKTLKIVSSKPSQLSYEYDEIKHGVFTYYLVQAMMGRADQAPVDEEMTADEIRDFIRRNVKTYTSKKQSPSLYTDDDDEVLALANPIYVDITSENIDMMKAVYSEKVAGLFSIDLDFDQALLSQAERNTVANFSKALESLNLIGNDSSAYEIYQSSLQANQDSVLLNIIKNNLVNALNTESQKTVNNFLGDKEKDTSVLDYRTASMAVSASLNLIDANNFNYNTILARKLFFDAYIIIRNKDYRQYALAEEKLLKSLKILPNASYTHNSLGQLYAYWHNYPKAEFHLKKTIEGIPTWAKPHNDLGNVYQSQGNYSAALSEFQRALQLDSTYSNPYNNIGNIYLETGRYRQAEENYNLRLERDSAAIITLMNLGVLSGLRGQSNVAEEYFRKVVAIDSTYGLGYVKIGNHLIDGYKKPEGLLYLQKAMNKEPDNPECIVPLANYYTYSYDVVSEKRKALPLFEKALIIDPYYYSAYANLGWYYYNSKDNKKAFEYFQLAIDSIPYRAAPYRQMARYYRFLGDHEKAIEYFEKAIETDPYNYPSYESYVILYENDLKNIEKAENILKQAWDKFEESPLVAKDIADFYYRNGDTAEAIRFYEAAKVIDTSFAYSYSSLALIYLKKYEFEKALQNYIKAAELMPHKLNVNDFRKNIENMAIGLMNTNIDKAISGFNTLLSDNPDNITALKNLAWIYYLEGEPKKALTYINSCLSQTKLSYNQEKRYLNLKSLILFDLKKYDDALEILNGIIAKSPMPTYLEKSVVLFAMKDVDESMDFYRKEKELPYSKLNLSVVTNNYSENFNKYLAKLKKTFNK